MGIIVKTLPSRDGVVRKIEVKVTHNKITKAYYRLILDYSITFFSLQEISLMFT